MKRDDLKSKPPILIEIPKDGASKEKPTPSKERDQKRREPSRSREKSRDSTDKEKRNRSIEKNRKVTSGAKRDQIQIPNSAVVKDARTQPIAAKRDNLRSGQMPSKNSVELNDTFRG